MHFYSIDRMKGWKQVHIREGLFNRVARKVQESEDITSVAMYADLSIRAQLEKDDREKEKCPVCM